MRSSQFVFRAVGRASAGGLHVTIVWTVWN